MSGKHNSSQVRIGDVTIGGGRPVAVQSMTDTDTNDTAACLAQIGRIYAAGGRIVRLTAQGVREGENLRNIARECRKLYPGLALVADVHFLPRVAEIAAEYVDKVRINPGNYNDRGDDFARLLSKCAARGVALRIGVNHGSLARRVVDEFGDTPRGMVASAMEFLRVCRERGFDNVVVSMKSSNTRVMVHAYRLLVAAMRAEGMHYPLHLGVTEAGNGIEGRIKSAVGIGALLADGVGDTIRVSLTEPPENEIPVALALVEHFAGAGRGARVSGAANVVGGAGIPGTPLAEGALFDSYSYSRRPSRRMGRLGGGAVPLLYSELNDEELGAVSRGEVAVISAVGDDPVGQWRDELARMNAAGDDRPVILHRTYRADSTERLAIMAAADFGVMFLDGLADGISLDVQGNAIGRDELDAISLDILQAARARMSKTEFIACPGCGRTLYDLQSTLFAIKERTGHLNGLKIGVMGCIVNGPGEMADADYGYVGAAPGHISLYRGRELIRRDIPQQEALDALVALIIADEKWVDPPALKSLF